MKNKVTPDYVNLVLESFIESNITEYNQKLTESQNRTTTKEEQLLTELYDLDGNINVDEDGYKNFLIKMMSKK